MAKVSVTTNVPADVAALYGPENVPAEYGGKSPVVVPTPTGGKA